jgi:hypothetical protein
MGIINTFMKKILLLLSIIAITGCSADLVRRQFQTAVEAATDDCRKMGYTPGTQAFVSCVDRTSQNIRNNAARAQSNNYNPAPPINFAPIPNTTQQYNNNRGVSCVTRLGGRVECTPN